MSAIQRKFDEAREIRLLHNLIDGRINGVKSAFSEIEKGGAE